MDLGSVGTIAHNGGAAAWADQAGATAGEAPVEPIDHELESAGVKILARPQGPMPASMAQLHSTDTNLPSAANATDFALPADQLIPVALTGLQVEAAWSWPLLRHGFEPRTSLDEREPQRRPARADDEAEPDAAPAETGSNAPIEADSAGDHSTLEYEDTGDTTWCEPLTRALREALSARIAPQALLAAADQWRRGRCVVLACPQTSDPAGPAWAFVLWPRRRPVAALLSAPARRALPLALYGLRVEARLQWSAPPGETQWCHVRVIKEHHPQRGRQLVALKGADAAAADTTRVPCEVQLGPVLARSLRWCEVCVRIQAVQRFWAALGAQWSATVVVCSQPLVGTRAS